MLSRWAADLAAILPDSVTQYMVAAQLGWAGVNVRILQCSGTTQRWAESKNEARHCSLNSLLRNYQPTSWPSLSTPPR